MFLAQMRYLAPSTAVLLAVLPCLTLFQQSRFTVWPSVTTTTKPVVERPF